MTEDTIEEKVVERAQQKLKLDAMVVQRGMLQGEKKLEKDEMLAAIRCSGVEVILSTSFRRRNESRRNVEYCIACFPYGNTVVFCRWLPLKFADHGSQALCGAPTAVRSK